MVTKRRLLKYAFLVIVGTYLFVLALTEVYIKQHSNQLHNSEAVEKQSGNNDVLSQKVIVPTKSAKGQPGSGVVVKADKTGENAKEQLERLKEMNDQLLKEFLAEFPEMRDAYNANRISKPDRLVPECGLGIGSRRDKSSPAAANLPLAPPVFYPLSVEHRQNKAIPGVDLTGLAQSHNCKPTEKRWTNQCCRTVYFLGGGKCGSTSLALLLKHNMSSLDHFDPTSGFADGGKEPCWALTAGNEREFYSKFRQCQQPRYKCGSSSSDIGINHPQHLLRRYQPRQQTAEGGSKTVVLDGCPRYSKAMSARKIACADPDAKFVMLVRDPLLRTISDHNDHMIRGSGKTRGLSEKDRRTLSTRSLTLSDYRSILSNFLLFVPPENILIVQSEFLLTEKYVQHIMTQVQNHFQIPNRQVRYVKSNANSDDSKYTLPSKTSFELSLSKLCPKSLGFFKLVGYSFDWLLNPSDPRAVSNYQTLQGDYNL